MNQQQESVNTELGLFPEQFQVIVHIETTVPMMHPEKFAESIGRTSGVIGGWLDLGYLPTVKVDKYQMINLVSVLFGCL